MSTKTSKKLPCVNCRQQKARCDIDINSGSPCSRCSRLNQTCEISADYKRQAKRRRFHEFQPLGAGAPQQYSNGGIPHRSNTDNSSHDAVSTWRRPRIPDHATHPRSLEGINISAKTIDEIFAIFFEKYHPFLPILDSSVSPNEYHEKSQFLFWTILGIAGQTSSDSSVSLGLSPKINNLAFDCLKWRQLFLESIKALLILLTWPLSVGCPQDMTFTLSGAAIHMGMLIGLHVPLSSQEFAPKRLALNEVEVNERIDLWTRCLITHGRVCSMKGIASMTTGAVASDQDSLGVIGSRLAPPLAYQARMHRIVMRCNIAVQRNGLKTLSTDSERAMEIFVNVFSDQLNDLAHEASSDYDKLLHAIAQLQIKSYVFFKVHSPIDPQSLVSLHTISCHIIRSAKNLDESEGFLPRAPIYFQFSILMAAYVLLRLLKSPFAKYLNKEVEECFLATIEMCKRLSVISGDPARKHATALSQLWTSTKAFKRSDGSDYTVLRLRTRLAMSAVFDALWWWKEEFQGQEWYIESGQSSQTQTSNISMPFQALDLDNSATPSEQLGFNDTEMSMFDEGLLAEFGLGASFDAMGWPDMAQMNVEP